jgi:LysR family transcriptional regulator, regulator of abg operon
MLCRVQLNQLKALLAATKTGSIRAAARELRIAQPAISAAISRLERELGVQLLVRSASGVRVTAAGAAFRNRIALAVTELERAKEAAQQNADLAGAVTFAVTASVALTLMSPAVRAFQRQFPNVELQILEVAYQAAHEAMRRGELDFSIGPMSPRGESPELRAELLSESAMVPFARKGHPALARRVALADLMDYRWVFMSHGAGISEAMFTRHGLKPPRHTRCQALSTWLPLILENDYLTLLPEAIMTSGLLRDLLEPVDIVEPAEIARYYLLTLASAPLTPAATALADQFRNATAIARRSLSIKAKKVAG